MTTNYRHGFTLIELLLVVSILSIVFGIGIPSFSTVMEQANRQDYLYRLLNSLSFARTEAITRGSSVTLCPLDDKNRCSRKWNQKITVFTDPARKRELTNSSDILRIISKPKDGKLYGKTGIRQHFGFRPTGMARESIGHLLWCPQDKSAKKAFQIRINMGGRPYSQGTLMEMKLLKTPMDGTSIAPSTLNSDNNRSTLR